MSSSRTDSLHAVWLATLILGACMFESVGVDNDADRIRDERDNCPDVANPDQLDFDADGRGDACQTCAAPEGIDADADGIDDACDACVGPGPRYQDEGGDGIDDGCQACTSATGDDIDRDGIDDACDRCLLGPPHDEDGDGTDDPCDGCPALADPAQLRNLDSDRLGDACDLDTDPQVPRLFDAFTTDDVEAWEAAPGFTVDAGQLAIAPTAMERRLRRIAGDRARVELVITSLSGAGTMGMSLVGKEPACPSMVCNDRTLRCALDASGRTTLEMSDGATQFTANAPSAASLAQPVTLRLRLLRTVSNSVTYECTATDQSGAHTASFMPTLYLYPFEIKLTPVSVTATVSSFWLVGG